ncbi:MAG: lysylphosphatidylglycerol synthase transmembrane domain-containing protein [Chloroflexota bacterium]
MKRWQSLLLGVVVSVATLAYALRGIDFNQLGGELLRGRYLFLLPTLLLGIAGLALRGVRWRALLDNRIGLGHSFNILNASYLFNTFLPLRLGEVVRAFMATRLTPPISMFTSLSSIVVERLADILAVVLLVVLAVTIAPVTPEIENAARISGIIAVVGMIALSIFAARRSLAHQVLNLVLRLLPFLKRFNLTTLADHVLDGIAPLGTLRGAAAAFGWTAIAWAVSVGMSFVLMYVFYDQPQLNAVLLITAAASLAVALPAVPGSVGPFEAAVVLGLTVSGMASAGVPEQQARAVAYAVLLHIVGVAQYAFLGFLGLSQEKISLGDVLRAARQLTSRSKNATPAPTTPS